MGPCHLGLLLLSYLKSWASQEKQRQLAPSSSLQLQSFLAMTWWQMLFFFSIMLETKNILTTSIAVAICCLRFIALFLTLPIKWLIWPLMWLGKERTADFSFSNRTLSPSPDLSTQPAELLEALFLSPASQISSASLRPVQDGAACRALGIAEEGTHAELTDSVTSSICSLFL